MKKLLIAAVILAAAVACGEASSSSQAHQPLALSNGSVQQAPDKSTAALPPGQTTYGQNQPGQITQQIEQLKGQIQYLDNNTSFSTVTVNIVEAGAPAPTAASDNWGFATALGDAAHNFVTTINYLITGLGA